MIKTIPALINHTGDTQVHNIEIVDGKAQIAYAGETPWHGLGTKVPNDLTPEQMCKAAGLDWEVEKRPCYATINGKQVRTPSAYITRLPNGTNIKDEKFLSYLPNAASWHLLQNHEAFAFFNEAIALGDMEMHTAGSLADGELVWAMAKVRESFALKTRKGQDDDVVESYLLFTNPHRFGKSIDVRFTPTRVVCNNTLTIALTETTNMLKVSSSHRNPFNKAVVQEKLDMAHYKLGEYREHATFLSSTRYKNEDVVEYFKRVFPANAPKKRQPGQAEAKRPPKEFHRGASVGIASLETQPGADMFPGTFWNLYCAATYYTNHLAGKSDSTRVESLWYGDAQKQNINALNTALEMAKAA